MTSLTDRLAEFIADRLPSDGSPVELLCQDHCGTYVIPFACGRVEDAWRNLRSGEVIEAEVVGWRPKAPKLSRERRGGFAGGLG